MATTLLFQSLKYGLKITKNYNNYTIYHDIKLGFKTTNTGDNLISHAINGWYEWDK